ncbi:PAS/PAC sensor signal transduction histidine kinase [Sporocytophaga myxococcoides]|uniref:histidine kinase n=1 Tax=Sporocytophaga myxococcoides TaxID=153721 RepID=A0A098LHW2_9BACT|nr:PAS domain-containing sensor histidine kinase [Sporocytophaga myxococcoides]GAL85713.1 PAS/PAC sensor signal transduction histidine kinase [Sporocytophaga myxococcoides]
MSHNTFQDKEIKQIDTSTFFTEVMENSQAAGVIVMNVNGIMLDSSISVQKVLGYAKEDLIGNYYGLLFVPEDRLKNLPEVELKTVKQKGSFIDDNYLLHKKGAYIWIHGESIYTQDKEGNIFIIKVIFDINEKKLLEEQLTHSNQKLVNINNDLENFIYTASHDLKAPINNIDGLLASVKEELDSECKKKLEESGILEMLNISIQKFKNTLYDLASIGKTQSGIAEELKSRVDFKEVLDQVKFDLMDDIENSHAKIYDYFTEASFINFSRKNLRSILYNLLSNAIKYASPERIPEIIIRTSKVREDLILLEVKDNGLGISTKDHGKVFSMYERIHTHIEGTGVGLNIVKRIVENNGGKIELESQEGKGSTFKIYFKEEE